MTNSSMPMDKALAQALSLAEWFDKFGGVRLSPDKIARLAELLSNPRPDGRGGDMVKKKQERLAREALMGEVDAWN